MTESQFHSQITNSSPDLAKAEHLATQNLRKDAVDAGTAKPEIVEAEQRILESLKLLSTVRQSGEDQSPLLESSDGSPSAPTPADSPVLGDFRIMSEIAKGGMGVVYEAEQISLGRRVALKLLPFAANLDERHLLRFKNEACAAASLTHANIVPIYSIGCEQGLHFYAMQFIQGETLNNYITRADSSPKLTAASSKTFASNQPLTATKLIQDISAKEFPNHENAKIEVSVPKLASQLNDLEVPAFLKPRFESEKSDRGSGNFKLSKPIRQMRSIADWGRQVAEALAYAHSVGVIHRDVKPGNVMIDSASKAWIMDFGVALMKRDAGVTTTGDLVGTLRYMSPEQAAGKRGVLDHRTDIYSLGVTLYELLAQQNFFNEPDRGHLLQKILNDTPNYVRSINPSIPRDLATIVHKAIEREPKDRYNTADEMAEDLRRFLADQPILSKPPSISDRVKRCYRRNYLLLNFAFTSLLIIAITIGFAAISIRHERENAEKERRSRLAEKELTAAANESVQLFHYVTNINLADHALKIGEPGEAQKILEQVHPSLADRDYRGFEWHLLSEMARKAPSSLGFHKGDAYGSDLSPDRRLLATCGQDGIRIWNLSTGQEVRELTDHNSDVNGVSFSPNGLWIASASDDRTVRIWSTEDWSCLHVISHDVEVVNAVFSPDSRLLATGERLSKGTDGQEPKAVIRFWKAGSWEQVGDDLSGHSKDLQVITFNDNGTLLASASSDGTACVWDVESRSLRHRLKCSSPNDNYAVVSCVAFAHQRPFVATVGGAGLAGYVQIWNLNDGSPVTKLPGSEQDIQGVVFSPDDSLVAACGNENLVYGWKIRPDGTHTDNVVSHATSRVWSVNFLNATDVVTTEKDGAVRRRRLFSRSQEKRILSSSRTAPVFEFYPDGDTLVVANGGLAIHSISNRIESSQLEPLSAGTKLIAISQDARNLVSFGKDLRIKVRGKDGAVRTSDRLGYDLHSLVFTEHDQHIAAITQRRADFFDPLTLKQASSLTFIERRSSRGIVEASPGGMNYSVLPGNGSLEMWGQQRRLWTIDGIGDVLNPIQFSRDSRQVAICRTDGVIQVWQVSDPKASVTLVGRFNERATLGFSADGRTLGGVYDDGTVKLWNVSTGREMLTLDSKLTIGGRIVFSPRGNAFAVSGKNAQEMYEIVIWKLAPEPDSTAIGK